MPSSAHLYLTYRLHAWLRGHLTIVKGVNTTNMHEEVLWSKPDASSKQVRAVETCKPSDIMGEITLAAAAAVSTVFCWHSLQTKYAGGFFFAVLPRTHLVCCQTLQSSHSIIA